MRYVGLLLGFIYLGFLAFLPSAEASQSAKVRYCEDRIWTDGIDENHRCEWDDDHEWDDRDDDDRDHDDDRWDNDDDDDDRWDDEDDDDKHDRRDRRHDGDDYFDSDVYRFLYQRRADDRRFDHVVRRYSEPESRLTFGSPLEQYIVSAPFRASRAQLHPYFRNSPLQGYAPAFGYAYNNPAYRTFVNDQSARAALGLPVQPVSPSAVCKNYTVFRYAQKLPAFLESCN